MTLQQLIDWCKAKGVDMNTPIAIRDKDDYLLVEDNIIVEARPYFGNCSNGEEYLQAHAVRDANGDIDYDNLPDFIVLGTGY